MRLDYPPRLNGVLPHEHTRIYGRGFSVQNKECLSRCLRHFDGQRIGCGNAAAADDINLWFLGSSSLCSGLLSGWLRAFLRGSSPSSRR
jgi:hypothetical protein